MSYEPTQVKASPDSFERCFEDEYLEVCHRDVAELKTAWTGRPEVTTGNSTPKPTVQT